MSIRTVIFAAWAAVSLGIGVGHAEVQTETFYNPKVLKKAVDWCLEPGTCGKIAADEYCGTVGYSEAQSFQRSPSNKPTIFLGTGETCDPENGCEAITKVICKRDTKFILLQPDKGEILKNAADAMSDDEDDSSSGSGGGGDEPPDPGSENVLNELGGKVQGDVATARFADKGKSRIAVFARGMDNALWWQAGNGEGKWYGWQSLGGVMKLSPSCDFSDGRLYCAVVGADNGIWVNSTAPGKVSSWQGFGNLAGKTKSSPSVVAGSLNGNQAVLVFVRGMDDKLYYNAFVEDPETELSNWTGWQGTGRPIFSSPACLRTNNGIVNCYFRNPPDNGIREMENVLGGGKQRVIDGETEKIPGVLRGKVKSDIRLLVTGLDGKLWVNRKNSKGNWGNFVETEYSFTGQPVCHSMDNGKANWCFAVKSNGSPVAQNLPDAAFSGK